MAFTMHRMVLSSIVILRNLCKVRDPGGEGGFFYRERIQRDLHLPMPVESCVVRRESLPAGVEAWWPVGQHA